MTRRHDTILAVAIIAAAVATSIVLNGVLGTNTAVAESDNEETTSPKTELTNYTVPTYPWQELGYTNVMDYHNDLKAKNEEAVGSADEAIETYAEVITDEQIETLRNCELQMSKALTFEKYNKYLDEFNGVIDVCEEALAEYLESQNVQISYANNTSSSAQSNSSSVAYYESNGSGLTKSAGVNYYNGRRETWYSSSVLYHYKTGEWTLGSDGVYRDSDGYIIVASSDLAYGSTVDTSLGAGKVYDSGCAAGTSDIYTAW